MNVDPLRGELISQEYCAQCQKKTPHSVFQIPPTRLSDGPGIKYDGTCKVCLSLLSRSTETERQKRAANPMLVGSVTLDGSGSGVVVQFEKDKEIIQAVREMRDLQKQFFKDTRNMDVLSRAKAAEKRVDALLAEMDSPQGRLM